jgi:hypothetical protein
MPGSGFALSANGLQAERQNRRTFNLQLNLEARSTYNRRLRKRGRLRLLRLRSEMEDTFPDLGSLSDKELKDLIDKLTEEENEISYKRRVLHGKIDILRAELVNRLRDKHERGDSMISGDDVSKLTDILAGKQQQTSEDEPAA